MAVAIFVSTSDIEYELNIVDLEEAAMGWVLRLLNMSHDFSKYHENYTDKNRIE